MLVWAKIRIWDRACIIPRLPRTVYVSEDWYTLERAETGFSKDRLDNADISLKVAEVMESFDKFLKLD